GGGLRLLRALGRSRASGRLRARRVVVVVGHSVQRARDRPVRRGRDGGPDGYSGAMSTSASASGSPAIPPPPGGHALRVAVPRRGRSASALPVVDETSAG